MTAPVFTDILDAVFGTLSNEFVYPFLLAGIAISGLARVVRIVKSAIR